MERIGCPSFAFKFVSLEETVKEVNKLSFKKVFQTLDISVKIIKENKVWSQTLYILISITHLKYVISKRFKICRWDACI